MAGDGPGLHRSRLRRFPARDACDPPHQGGGRGEGSDRTGGRSPGSVSVTQLLLAVRDEACLQFAALFPNRRCTHLVRGSANNNVPG